MTPLDGFYGLFDLSGQIRREMFSRGLLPPLQSAAPPLWTAAWTPAGEGAGCSTEGGRSLLFQGELYNIDELRRQLDAADHVPVPHLLLLAHARWSLDFVLRLDGLFVLALRDGERLHLYRDGSGARNLYYATQQRGQIAFATHLDTLLRLPGVEKRLARRSLHEYLRFLDIAAPNTLYEDVLALEAGQLLTWTATGPSLHHPCIRGEAPRSVASFEQSLDTLDDLLHQSIAHRLRDIDTPAAFLSGGVDSSLICAIASSIEPRLTAVTVGFEGPQYDEAPIARAVATHLGIEHQILRFARPDYLAAFETFQCQAEQPVGDPAAPATLLAFDYCRERFEAVLDGSGADESAGMLPPRHVRAAVEHATLLPAPLRRAIVGALRHLPGLAAYAPIFDFEHPAELMIRWHGFARVEIEALCEEPVSLEHTHFFQTFACYPRNAHFERSIALLDAMPGDRLHQAAALSGLPVRYPFWDKAVDSYIRSLPPDYRFRPAEPKRILRSMLARHVPRKVWDVAKHGFDFPLEEFLCAEDFQLVHRYLLNDRWATWQVLSTERVAEYGRRFIAGERNLRFRIWALVVLSAWLEGHND
jgi:asparagine synthase (glutamine-hydrolysing)